MENLEIKKIDFNGFEVRAFEKNEIIHFVAMDLAPLIEHKNINRTINRSLDTDEIEYIYINDKSNKVAEHLCINESGFYKLMFKSNLPKAKEFTKFITNVILPEIRRTGGYGNKVQTDFIKKLATNETEISNLVTQRKAINKRLLFLRLNNENIKDTLYKSVNIPSSQSTQLELF